MHIISDEVYWIWDSRRQAVEALPECPVCGQALGILDQVMTEGREVLGCSLCLALAQVEAGGRVKDRSGRLLREGEWFYRSRRRGGVIGTERAVLERCAPDLWAGREVC